MRKELRTVHIDEIKPYEGNPRRNDDAVAAVVESIRQCNYISPIIVDEDMVILAGHTRHKALKQMGAEQCEVLIIYGLTKPQKKKYRLLDNKTNEYAEWDYELLGTELEDLDFEGFDFGFDFDFGEDEEAVEITEDEAPEIDEEAEPITKLGDIWQLGRHRLMCGDSTSAESVQVLLGGGTG